jgi:hypothetical protein
MTYSHRSGHAFLDAPASSAFSRPRRERPDGSYEIHLVKANDPTYMPGDLEVWPLYYRAIVDCLVPYRDAHDAVLKAFRDTRAKLTGFENRDAPPGSTPRLPFQ